MTSPQVKAVQDDCCKTLANKLRQVAKWLESNAAQLEQQAKDSRFPSFSEACASDARNYRATADDIRAALKAAGEQS